MATLLINALAAASSPELSAYAVLDWPVTIIAGGLGAAETIPVQVHTGGGFVDYYAEGAQVLITSTNNAISLVSPARYKFVKGTTSGAVTLGYSTRQVP